MLAPWKKSYDKPRWHILLTKVCRVKAMVFPVVMYGCESWAINKAEHWRTDVIKLWYWRRLLRVLWTTRRSEQSILNGIIQYLSSYVWFISHSVRFPRFFHAIASVLFYSWIIFHWGFPGALVVKNMPANAGDAGLIPDLGRSPEGEHGNPLQYSCLARKIPWTEEPGGL